MIGEFLRKGGRISAADLARAQAAAQADSLPLDRVLVSLGLISDLDRVEILARLLRLPLLRAEDLTAAPDLSAHLSASYLRDRLALPYAVADGRLYVALSDPGDEDLLEALEFATGLVPEPALATRVDIEAAIDRLYGGGSTLDRIVGDMEPGLAGGGEEDIDRLKDLASEAPVVRLVTHIIEDAARMKASDIHIEPFAEQLSLRYRIDGVLRDMPPPPLGLARAVVSRIKILAGLNIAERRLPQDGRVQHSTGSRRLDLRVATLPTVHGESVVIRLLDGSVGARALSALGLHEADERTLRRLIEAPHGMVLVTGPTGSGKTTTLYAALRLVDAATRKVLTVEDPVEYQMERINQVQVRPAIGLTFANVLRALVRQDPDVILVGETRDNETADIAVHAALTGHLVLTTLHTNTAAGALTRLIDMGVEPFLLASTVRGVVGQRLVRVLCPRCRRTVPADGLTLAALRRAGLVDGQVPLIGEPVGCDHCGGSGYSGRIGIFELLALDDDLRDLIVSGSASSRLEQAARSRGMRSMYEDGLSKVLAGLTTFAEVARVTDAGG
jgi:general secretion pathway protein E